MLLRIKEEAAAQANAVVPKEDDPIDVQNGLQQAVARNYRCNSRAELTSCRSVRKGLTVRCPMLAGSASLTRRR